MNHKEEEKINMKRKKKIEEEEKKKCVCTGGRLCGKDPLISVQTPTCLLGSCLLCYFPASL